MSVPSDCVFCKIVAGKLPSQRVYEDAHTLAFLDIRPVATGHTLVIPKKHYDDLLATPPAELQYVVESARLLARGILLATGSEGFNLGVNNGTIAGQVVFHFHVHIIPRFPSDNLRPWGSRSDGADGRVAENIRQALKGVSGS